jgi:3-oxoacyl-[acyl-carrier protein] reductase
MKLSGCVAFVTGGGSGLGLATTRGLAKKGADICISYRDNKDSAMLACDEIRAIGRRAALVRLDQADPASVEAATDSVIEQLGQLDILVNNAATNIPVPFPDLGALTPEIWDQLFNTNLRGPFLMARAAAPHLRKSNAGRIVNVGAMIGLMPAGSSIAQAVTKAGVIHLTRCLAVALAPNVTVNCVAPGLMEGTQMARRVPPEAVNAMRDRALLKRNTSIQDVADQIVQFCGAETVTGQVLVIDGGIFFH